MSTLNFDLAKMVEQLESLEQRNACLERRLRRLAVAGTFLLVLMGVVVGVGAAAQNAPVIHAQAFVLDDPNGHTRGSWTLDKDGSTILSLINDQQARKDKVPSVRLRASDINSSMACFQPDASEGAGIKTGGAVMNVNHTAQGNDVSQGQLTLRDSSGKSKTYP